MSRLILFAIALLLAGLIAWPAENDSAIAAGAGSNKTIYKYWD